MTDPAEHGLKPGTRVHLLGAGGIGVSALAQWLTHLGHQVSGSDRVDSSVLDMLRARGITVKIEPNGATLPDDADVLVFSDAVPPEDPARRRATEKGIPQYSYAEMLGKLSEPFDVLAISGSHGKSTTTALASLILTHAAKDPTVVIGTRVPAFENSNFRAGKSSLFVVEADEYRGHCLHFQPKIGVITTTDHDHVDAFPTLAVYWDVYRKFADRLRPDGKLILRASDPLTEELRTRVGSERTVTFALASENIEADFLATAPVLADGRMTFRVTRAGKDLGEFTMKLPGDHLVLDVLAALAAADILGVSMEKVREALETFTGTWRRFERVGSVKGADVISDYGHHPTELRALLSAAQPWFVGRRIILVFQPHQKIRTRAFQNEFLRVLPLPKPHILILCEVYDVAGREETGDRTTTEGWVEPLRKSGTDVRFAPTLDDAEAKTREIVQPNDVVLVVGAGTVDVVARNLVKP